MRVRGMAAAAAVAGVMLIGGGGAGSANVLWCVSDPPSEVESPSGTNLTVNNYYYASDTDAHLLQLVTDEVSTSPDGAGGTLVTVEVEVPHAISVLYVVSTVQRYQVSATGSGKGGTDIVLTLDVPTA